MKPSVLVKVAGQSILKNKMRTLLTMLGIIIGVAAVLVMVAVGQGARSTIRDQINGLGTNMIVITPGASNQGGVSQGAGSVNSISLDDAAKLQREGDLLTYVSPVVFTFGQAKSGTSNWRARVNGVDVGYQNIRDWPLDSGTFFTTDDVRARRKVAVLGRTVADQLFSGMDPVGQRFQLRDSVFDIIGVLSRKGQTANGTDQDDVILIPYTTLQTRLSGFRRLPQILVSTSSPDMIPAAQEQVRTIMREAHKLNDGEPDDFTVRNQTDLAEAAESSTKVMTMLLAAIASISLLVGGIGIMNIMLVSVTERTREIGIRMAVGARGGDVLTQFLVESIVMSIVGGIIGLVTGFAGARIVAHFTGWTTQVSPMMVFVAIGFSAAVGIFFGFYPARKAAALNPIEALRFE
ncbi:MAG: ABC transporter permease [Thermoanaerobaculia bacterium]